MDFSELRELSRIISHVGGETFKFIAQLSEVGRCGGSSKHIVSSLRVSFVDMSSSTRRSRAACQLDLDV